MNTQEQHNPKVEQHNPKQEQLNPKPAQPEPTLSHTLIFATNNANKVAEIQSAIGDQIRVTTMRAAGLDIDIPEPHTTLEENAREKSTTIFRLTGTDTFSEDSGLEVEALDGEPGVISARYAGEQRSDKDNIDLLLKNLNDKPNKKARFRTVISLIVAGSEHQFEGICEGRIIDQPAGSAGFGYDPIFVPDGAAKTFAQMTMEEKNQVSHRRKAADKLIEFLRSSIDSAGGTRGTDKTFSTDNAFSTGNTGAPLNTQL